MKSMSFFYVMKQVNRKKKKNKIKYKSRLTTYKFNFQWRRNVFPQVQQAKKVDFPT